MPALVQRAARHRDRPHGCDLCHGREPARPGKASWGAVMAQIHRLARGGRIDRGQPIAMRFNGATIAAYVGDTAASALLANGILFLARSFKYHRPRGVFSHGSEEPNAILAVDRGGGRIDPNSRASAIEAVNGLQLRSQNHWPSLGLDLAAVSDWLAPLLV